MSALVFQQMNPCCFMYGAVTSFSKRFLYYDVINSFIIREVQSFCVEISKIHAIFSYFTYSGGSRNSKTGGGRSRRGIIF